MSRYQNAPHESEPLDSYGSPPPRTMSPDEPYHDASHTDSHSSSHPQPPSVMGYQDGYHPSYESASTAAPPPPRHGNAYNSRGRSDRPPVSVGYAPNTVHSTVTPGADNFSETAAGGMAGIAYGVAERSPRESGLEALQSGRLPPPPSHANLPPPRNAGYGGQPRNSFPARDHHGANLNPLGFPAVAPSSRSPSRSPNDPYLDDPYNQVYAGTPRNNNSTLGIVNPNEIEDDGDDGLDYSRHSQRNSILSASNSDKAAKGAVAASAAVGAAAGAGRGVLNKSYGNGSGNGNGPEYDLNTGQEKSSEWLAQQNSKNKKWKWLIIALLMAVIAGAIIGGVVGGLVHGSKSGGKSGKGGGGHGGSGGGSSSGGAGDGSLTLNSPEIQGLLNNKNLHKVFPGIDYTPQNTQYPACLDDPPLQDNVTMDVAVLSQLTNKIRLYGTDCNQTEMVLFSIDALKMSSTIKVWLGVWQDNNGTTNARQLKQMWDILDKYGSDPFEGIIVANEALFRQQFTVASLGSLMDEVRSNLTAKSINLPVATSDLGDDWTSALAADSDYIMANVHPFFAGVPATEAASWTWDFWSQHDGTFWKTDKSKNIISETGWPSGGGTDCGSDSVTSCPDGSVAGIQEMNQFMSDWVCQALANGTNYFWFEAFDEPWKVSFNTPGKEWEDKWGLMDADRNLKKGVQIPDCGGSTVS